MKIMVEYASMCLKSHALLGRVSNASTAAEQAELKRISSKTPVCATLLPLRSVGVQGTFIISIILKTRGTGLLPKKKPKRERERELETSNKESKV